ncbi:MAG: RNA polymerase sigma factor [Paenibacillaceae bacterium]
MKWEHFMEVEQFSLDDQDEILDHLYKHMFMVAYAKMKNRSDALDVVQESWVKILNKLETLRDPKKLIQWSKVIVANTAINVLKKRSAHVVSLYDEQMSIDDLDIGLNMEEKLLKQTIYESLSILDEETRKMMICKFYYGWKDQQIAEIMEMPVGTVKARIHRAKVRLREHLVAEFGVFDIDIGIK